MAVCVCVCSESCPTLRPHGLVHQNTRVGSHFLLLGILGAEPTSLVSSALAGRFFTTEPLGKHGCILWLKLQYFDYLMQRAISLEKTLMLGKIAGKRRRERQRMRRLDSITDSTDMNLGKPRETEGQGSVVRCSPWGCKQLDMT